MTSGIESKAGCDGVELVVLPLTPFVPLAGSPFSCDAGMASGSLSLFLFLFPLDFSLLLLLRFLWLQRKEKNMRMVCWFYEHRVVSYVCGATLRARAQGNLSLLLRKRWRKQVDIRLLPFPTMSEVGGVASLFGTPMSLRTSHKLASVKQGPKKRSFRLAFPKSRVYSSLKDSTCVEEKEECIALRNRRGRRDWRGTSAGSRPAWGDCQAAATVVRLPMCGL